MRAQIMHSLPGWAIPSVLAANSFSLLLYNVAGMFVTEELGAVSRTVFESARTLFVWLVSLPSLVILSSHFSGLRCGYKSIIRAFLGSLRARFWE